MKLKETFRSLRFQFISISASRFTPTPAFHPKPAQIKPYTIYSFNVSHACQMSHWYSSLWYMTAYVCMYVSAVCGWHVPCRHQRHRNKIGYSWTTANRESYHNCHLISVQCLIMPSRAIPCRGAPGNKKLKTQSTTTNNSMMNWMCSVFCSHVWMKEWNTKYEHGVREKPPPHFRIYIVTPSKKFAALEIS